MNVRYTKRWGLIELVGDCQVTYRGTKFGTIILRDEFRTVEMIGPGQFVGAWTGTTIECDIPSWIRRAGLKAHMSLASKGGPR